MGPRTGYPNGFGWTGYLCQIESAFLGRLPAEGLVESGFWESVLDIHSPLDSWVPISFHSFFCPSLSLSFQSSFMASFSSSSFVFISELSSHSSFMLASSFQSSFALHSLLKQPQHTESIFPRWDILFVRKNWTNLGDNLSNFLPRILPAGFLGRLGTTHVFKVIPLAAYLAQMLEGFAQVFPDSSMSGIDAVKPTNPKNKVIPPLEKG